jgi:ribosomal protein S21
MSKHGPRVRVSYDDLSPSALRQSKDKIATILQRMFKKACQDYGVMQMYKEKEHFVGKGEKRRKKKMRAKIARIKGSKGEGLPQRDHDQQQQYNNNNRYNNREWDNNEF